METNSNAQSKQSFGRQKLITSKPPIVGETQPDFLITTPLSDRLVIEAKAWPRNRRDTLRAAHQARRYAQLSRAVGAILVTPDSAISCSPAGEITSLPSFDIALGSFVGTRFSNWGKSMKRGVRGAPKTVFDSMPFAAKYDDTYLVAISPAALALKATSKRIDHSGEVGDVIAQVKAMIEHAKVVIADLSDSRPNVCHEVGYAEALGRPVIQICSTPVDRLPFNLRNNQTIGYRIGQTTKLKTRLQTQLANLL